MTCPICGHDTLAPGTTTFASDAEGTVAVVRDVPAQVCGNCGALRKRKSSCRSVETACSYSNPAKVNRREAFMTMRRVRTPRALAPPFL